MSRDELQQRVSLAARRELDRRKRLREQSQELIASFNRFIRAAWDIVEPAKPLIDNWHIDAIADHLEAVERGDIRWLLINIGPGYAKSLIVSVLFSSWLWLRNPQLRILTGTYATSLTIRDSIRVRNLIESPWFRETFRPPWSLIKRNEDHLQNSVSGFRMALSVDSAATGFRGDGQIFDDLLNAKDAHSEAERQRAKRWIFETMSSRFDDMRKGWRVAIGQRLHEQDPYGEMLATGMYEHLCLPSEFEPHRRTVTSIGFTDPRTEPGELLFPELFTEEVLRQAKKELGSYSYAGQHQQRPSPDEGGFYKRQWWRYWQPAGASLPPIVVRVADEYIQIKPVTLPEKFDKQIQSWDFTFKDTDGSDFVVGQVWGRAKANKFLLDQVRERMDFVATCKAVRYLTGKHPFAKTRYIEDKANGPAVIASLKSEIGGLIPVEPIGSKQARAAASSPEVEAGNVYLPHPAIAPWVNDFIDEHAVFPVGAHDDQVDAQTQAIHKLDSMPEFFVGVV